jgi:hypothetical protein
MHTPHPSMVPLDLAAAGVPTVTSNFANKTAAELESLSANLIGVPPTVEAVADGIGRAVERSGDVSGRLAGADLAWPQSWHATFDDQTRARLDELLARIGWAR